jgi:hypothetical protein
LQTAKSQGWISDETAMKIMFEYCGEEVDIHAEREKIASQASQQQPLRDRYTSPTSASSPANGRQTGPLQGAQGYGDGLHPMTGGLS